MTNQLLAIIALLLAVLVFKALDLGWRGAVAIAASAFADYLFGPLGLCAFVLLMLIGFGIWYLADELHYRRKIRAWQKSLSRP